MYTKGEYVVMMDLTYFVSSSKNQRKMVFRAALSDSRIPKFGLDCNLYAI